MRHFRSWWPWLAFFVMVLSLLWLLSIQGEASPMPPELTALADRIDAQGDAAPQWKRDLLPAIRARKLTRFTANTTCYAFGRPEIDPPCGGNYAAWGMKLRWGHCAVDRRVIPLGSILYVQGIDQLLIAVDVGGAIRGHDVDIACETPERYFSLSKRFSHTNTPAWILGTVSKEQAR